MATESASKPLNLLALSPQEKRKLLDSIDFVFSDIDGVFWNFDANFENAAAGLTVLQQMGKKVTMVTNNSVRTAKLTAKKLSKAGLHVEDDDIIHPARSAVNYLKSINFDGQLYVLASASFKNLLKDFGFKVIDDPPDSIIESIYDLVPLLANRDPVKAVVIDFDFNLSQTKLMRAHLYLTDPSCQLIVGANEMLLPVTKRLSLLGPGQFSRILLENCNNKIVHIGKPGKDLAVLLQKLYDIKDPRRALMIGDSLEQDIAFGRECGFQTLAVLSGGCSLEDIKRQTDPKFIPDYYTENVGDFVEFISDINTSKM